MARRRLTPRDWIEAALRALARGGVAAVSVNALADELGATRGSFYWHFTDRDALLTAALELWAREGTTAVIETVSKVADPAERLRALFTTALTEDPFTGLEPAIVAHSDHPAVAPVLRRVTRERLDFLTELYTRLGLDPEAARCQSITAYAAYLGWLELRRSAADIVPEVGASGGEAENGLAHLIAQLSDPSPAAHRC
ncbi:MULTISPECIES: TetR/AcrR family transcriptional regulator [Streptomyces]|uniref:TetR/AcrR family transcriptional regulator n=1 Tax=Streptomyces TaxID=1883 RepID=UPI00292D103E|nr:TetR/AcrR family transcriptional regulator [Streptomyces sp. NEAU-HV9]